MKKKILFIEDDAIFLKAYATKFELEGFEVVSADAGSVALTMAKSNHPDFIILDIMLRGKQNGFDILEIIKGDPLLHDIPVLVLTNLDSEEMVAKQIGAIGYLVKTKTNPAKVAEYVKKILNGKINT